MKNVILPAIAAIVGFALGYIQRPDAPPPAAPLPTLVEGPPELANGGGHEAFTAFIAGGGFRQFAKIAATLEGMDARQIAAVLDRLEKLKSGEGDTLLPSIVAHWTRRDPDAAFAWMQPRLERFAKQKFFMSWFATADTNLVGAWAENDPARALELARTIPRTGLAEKLLHEGTHSLRGKTDAERFELLRNFPDGPARNSVIPSFCSSWSYREPAAVLAAAASLPPGTVRDAVLAAGLCSLAGKDRAGAFAKLRELGIRDARLEMKMIGDSARKDPRETAKWIEAQGAEFSPAASSAVVAQWAKRDMAAAFEWAMARGVSIAKTPGEFEAETGPTIVGNDWSYIGRESPLITAYESSPEATVRWVGSLPPGEERDRLFHHLATSYRPVAALKPVFATLPVETQLVLAVHFVRDAKPDEIEPITAGLTGEVRATAFRALGAKLGPAHTTPPGPDRDNLLDGYAYSAARETPAKALDAAMQIADPAMRRRTFDDVMWSITRGSIPLGGGASSASKPGTLSEAREWLEKANIPPDWKAQWR